METLLWILPIGLWALFIGMVVKDHFQEQADRREAQRRDLEYKMKEKL